MTQEEKQLLLKDLCARLLYKPYIEVEGYIGQLLSIEVPNSNLGGTITTTVAIFELNLDNIKLYLRPLSNMTEDEVKEFAALESVDVLGGDIKITCIELSIDAIDWLNAHHFDYRGLIQMGLALEAPQDMYNFK